MFGRKSEKSGIEIPIPGFGDRCIQTLLADYDGTLSCRGQIDDALKHRLIRLAATIDIHILTADKKAKDSGCLGSLPVRVHILHGKDQDVQKRDYLAGFAAAHVAVFGNGNNDRLLLQSVKSSGGLCIAVTNGQGCAVEAILNSHLLVQSPTEALDLLLNPDSIAATLRY